MSDDEFAGVKKRYLIIAAIALIAALFLFGYIQLPSGPSPGTGPGGWTPGPGPGTTPAPVAPTYSAAALQFTVTNAITGAAQASGATDVDVLKVGADGTIDFLDASGRSTDVDSDPEQTGATYAEGEMLVIHANSDIDSTGGAENYGGWFIVKLVLGEPVRHLSIANLQVVQTNPTYKYKVVSDGVPTGDSVQRTSGTTEYWGIGALPTTPRCTAANLDVSATHGSTTLSSITDGSTWDTTVTGASDVTFTTTSEKFWFKLDGGQTDTGYGAVMNYVSSIGQFKEYNAYILVTTSMTTIGVSGLQDKGWGVVSDSTLTAEKGFYKKINPQVPLRGNEFELDMEFPVDASAATTSTQYNFRLWVLDMQNEDNLKIGSTSSSVPSVYGMIGEFGIDTIIFARAYSTSSGVGSGQVLSWRITTA